MRHLIEQAMGFFDIADFEPTGDGNVGGNHVTDIGLRSLQMGREKSESFIPFPTVALPGAHKAEPEKQRCVYNLVLREKMFRWVTATLITTVGSGRRT